MWTAKKDKIIVHYAKWHGLIYRDDIIVLYSIAAMTKGYKWHFPFGDEAFLEKKFD